MGIALFTFGDLFAPLQALVGWLAGGAAPSPAPRHRAHRVRAAAAPAACAARRCRCRHAPAAARGARAGAGHRAAAAPGRMVISGRMADVCAELDRLAALEARGRARRDGRQALAPTR